jgi:hypothetical protein
MTQPMPSRVRTLSTPARGAVAFLLSGLAACGGGATPPSTTPPQTASPQVGGQYDVAVRLQQNDCAAAPTVLPQPTSVSHTPGASTFSLAHGGLIVTGTLARDGVFTTTALAVPDPQGPATLTIAGRFTTNGLEATVTVAVTSAGGACRYLVGWTGSKQGTPNVLG